VAHNKQKHHDLLPTMLHCLKAGNTRELQMAQATVVALRMVLQLADVRQAGSAASARTRHPSGSLEVSLDTCVHIWRYSVQQRKLNLLCKLGNSNRGHACIWTYCSCVFCPGIIIMFWPCWTPCWCTATSPACCAGTAEYMPPCMPCCGGCGCGGCGCWVVGRLLVAACCGTTFEYSCPPAAGAEKRVPAHSTISSRYHAACWCVGTVCCG
jgi:hypothetical protein